MKRLKRLAAFFIKLVVLMGCGLVTAYIVTNSAETAFNIDVPFAQAIASERLDAITTPITPDFLNHAGSNDYRGNFGNPVVLKLPAKQVKLPIAPAIYSNGQWLARSNTAHYIITGKADGGDLGDTVLYLRQSWRTIQDSSDLTVGANLFIDTDTNWRYLYKVAEVTQLSPDGKFVMATGRKPQIFLLMQSSDGTTIVRAEFVSVQGLQS